MKKVLFVIYILIIHILYSHAYSPLVSYTTSYTPDTYLGGTQNWCIDESNDGIVYIANNNGLLIKEGPNWLMLTTPRKQKLRCVKAIGEKIYVGGGNELGYFSKNIYGKYTYTDLTKQLDKSIKWGEAWRFIEREDKIYVQGGQGILVYNIKDNLLKAYYKSKDISYIEILSDTILLCDYNGCCKLSLDLKKKIPIPNSEILNGKTVRGIITHNDTCVFATLSHGIFFLTRKGMSSSTHHINQELIEKQIYCTASIGNNMFIFGTILDGLYITDKDFNVLQHINTFNGLQNNTVLSLKIDSQNNIWSGLDYGLSYIETSSPFKKYKFNREIGTAYTSIQSDEYIYWGTNQGLFFSKGNSEIHLMNGTQGQVYFLEQIGPYILCGHHNGLFLIEKDKVSKLSDTKGFDKINRINRFSNYYIIHTYRETFLYQYNPESKKINQKYRFVKRERELIPSQFYTDDTNLWTITNNKFVKAQIDTISMKYVELSTYKLEGKQKHIFKYGNGLVFESETKFFIYNRDKDSFIKFSKQNNELPLELDILKLFLKSRVDTDSIYELFKEYKEFLQPFSRIKKKLQNYDFSSSPQRNTIILNGQEGFINYSLSQEAEQSNWRLRAFFSQITSKQNNQYQFLTDNKIPYKWNNIKFKFFTNDNKHLSDIKFQYRLNGFEQEFSPLAEEYSKEYTNLPEGIYTFEVKGYNGYTYSDPIYFSFTITPPIYRSTWAKIIYVLLSVLCLYIGYLSIKKIIKLKEEKIEHKKQIEIEKMERLHKIERLNKERTIIMLEKEKLESDVLHKQQELTNSTHNILIKNELLINIKKELESIYKEKDTKLRDKALKRIFEKIDSNINSEKDWEIFEKYFIEIHQSFFKALKEKYPDLTQTDLKLCAYLRLNKTSKEIATLMNITIRGVETARYRLRKKMNLEHDENVSEILLLM